MLPGPTKDCVCFAMPGVFIAVMYRQDFFLHDFALMQLENLHHFSNVHNNFWFIAILHRLSVAVLIFCRRLAESHVTVMPVTCMYVLIMLML
jgi:hypothetical protein